MTRSSAYAGSPRVLPLTLARSEPATRRWVAQTYLIAANEGV